MWTKRLLTLLLCLAIKISAFAPPADVHPEPFALFTIPKSGSHLLIKTLHFMTGFTPLWHAKPPLLEKAFQNRHFPYTHCCLSPKLLNYYARSPVKQVLGVRDLRDVCVSIVSQIKKGVWPEFTNNREKTQIFNQLPFDEQLLFVINQEYAVSPPKVRLQLAIQKVAQQAVSLAKDPNILVCRYEDLVGAEGGGTKEKQLEIISKIASHIGVALAPSSIEEIAAHLYGDRDNPFGEGDFEKYKSTFRKGKIGAWKEAFKPVHKEAFKRVLGSALIALGYEQDDNW